MADISTKSSELNDAEETPTTNEREYAIKHYNRNKCRPAGRSGSGGVGWVEKFVQNDPEEMWFARKTMLKSCVSRTELGNEVNITRKAEHRHVISIIDEYEDEEAYYLVLLPLAKSNLQDFLWRFTQPYSPDQDFTTLGQQIADMFRNMYCMAVTVRDFHAKNIRHRDIKPPNILVGKKLPDLTLGAAEDNVLYFCDFGVSFMSDTDTVAASTHTIGTTYYRPPEAIKRQRRTKLRETANRVGRLGDVFSLGGCFVAILHAVCIRLGAPYPRDCPPANKGPYSNVVENPAFYRRMHDIRIPKENLDNLPPGLRFPGLTEALIIYTVSCMLRPKHERHDAARVARNLFAIMVDHGLYLNPCCDEQQQMIQAALKKMTPENFEEISDEFANMINQSKTDSHSRTPRLVIYFTYQKAINCGNRLSTYAEFFKRMLDNIRRDVDDAGVLDESDNTKSLASICRRYLLDLCQEEFESSRKVCLHKPGENTKMSDEVGLAAAAAKQRFLCLAQFVGELYRVGVVTATILHHCLFEIFDWKLVPDIAELQTLTKLFQRTGKKLDAEKKSREVVDMYFLRIEDILKVSGLGNQTRLMLWDMKDLRRSGWTLEEPDDNRPADQHHKYRHASTDTACHAVPDDQLSGGSDPPRTASSQPEPQVAREKAVAISDPVKELLVPDPEPSGGPNVTKIIGDILADISGLEAKDIRPESQLADMGIDSLMAMELGRELELAFKCSLPSDDLMVVTDVGGLVRAMQDFLGVGIDDSDSDNRSTPDSLTRSLESSSTADTSAPNDAKSMGLPGQGADNKTRGLDAQPTGGESPVMNLPASAIIGAFEESKNLTDQFIREYRCAGYMDEVLPKQTQLCVSLTIEAFEQLGCPIRHTKAGQRLERIPHLPEHQRLTDYLYTMLEREARLIDMDCHGGIFRTHVTAPMQSSESLLAGLLRDVPDHEWANRLTFYAGSRLADVLSGKCDGIKLIFGTDEGRRLVTGLYGDSLLNKLANVQMQDLLTRLVAKMPKDQGLLKILELGAGTGGTTRGMIATLAKLNVPIEYTFTDLSGSFVAMARKAFKDYPWMRYRVHDIEKEPAMDLFGTQHVIIASNAIHATHNLGQSLRNVREALRPDGFLMMLEMTSPVFWVDMIFGLFEGWWLFDDDRNHAIAHQTVWERELHKAGYGHVDWTDGHSPELEIQRVIIATASGPQHVRATLPPLPPTASETAIPAGRKIAIEEYVQKYASDFTPTPPTTESSSWTTGASPSPGQTVLVTGASGSLGAHLVAHVAALPEITSIICLNRRSTSEPEERQLRSMEDKGIILDAASHSKLRILQTDTRKPSLGLSREEYKDLVQSVTHIVHNAWPMSGKRPLASMEPQFQVMRNLIDLARDISSLRRASGTDKVTFQFISSIAVVGHYLGTATNGKGTTVLVPEESMAVESILPNGYGEAKYICERLLDETLHKHPDRFTAMSVRLGQIAGSRQSGYWNQVEHLAFLIKSSQTLKLLPALDGDLCWTPLEDVAGTLSDLLLRPDSDGSSRWPVYHIDNPVRQPWRDMLPVLQAALGIPPGNIIPFKDWVRRVRQFPGSVERDNPAAMLVDFLDDNFLRMSCGALLLDTKKSCEHSKTLANVQPVSANLARKYIQAWKDTGFLH